MAQSAVLLTANGRCKMFHTNHIEVTLFIAICIERASSTNTSSCASERSKHNYLYYIIIIMDMVSILQAYTHTYTNS